MYIHLLEKWPRFTWDDRQLIIPLAKVRNLQGKIIGAMESLGFELRTAASLEAMTLDVVKSAEIEGETVNPGQVRSSLARSLGMNIAGMVPSDRNVDGIVEVMYDATSNYAAPLTTDRLFGWHCALFPTGRSGIRKIVVGDWRHGDSGPMHVVSGAAGREKIHFEAPEPSRIPVEMDKLIGWFNNLPAIDPVVAAGLVHLWFVTIHPFADGNGRIARSLTDMLLARADGTAQRYYSMSSQIRTERIAYYHELERAQKGDLDITGWLLWFLSCLNGSLVSSSEVIGKVMDKYRFWQKYGTEIFNERQRAMLNRLIDGFEGKLTATKWGKMMKCSPDSALRDINGLISKGILVKETAGGRSTGYVLNGTNNKIF